VICIFLGCSKEQGNLVNDNFRVEHEGASLPIYVRGNISESTFIIMVHGAGGFGLAYRNEVFINDLESKYGVVYFDQRGQSMSEQGDGEVDDIIETMIDDIEAIYQVLKYEYGDDIKIFLAGHSWGGLQSGLAVVRDNIDLRGWINIAGVLDLPSISDDRIDLMLKIAEEQIPVSSFSGEWTSLVDQLEESLDYDEVLKLLSDYLSLVHKDNLVEKGFTSKTIYNGLVVNNPIHWYVNYFFNQPINEALEQGTTIVGNVDKIKLPVLFLYGKYDGSAPPENGKRIFDAIDSSEKEFVFFDKSEHYPYEREQAKFGEVVVDFIERYK